MNYLLDTHIIIWLAKDSDELPRKIKEIIRHPENIIYICSASFWEIAIKMSLGKLELELSLDKLMSDIKASDFNILQVEHEYVTNLLALPYIHKDPFDRLIIATALEEDLTIITKDEYIQKYDVSWIW